MPCWATHEETTNALGLFVAASPCSNVQEEGEKTHNAFCPGSVYHHGGAAKQRGTRRRLGVTSEDEAGPQNVSAGDQWWGLFFDEGFLILLLMVFSLFEAMQLLHKLPYAQAKTVEPMTSRTLKDLPTWRPPKNFRKSTEERAKRWAAFQKIVLKWLEAVMERKIVWWQQYGWSCPQIINVDTLRVSIIRLPQSLI